MADSAAQVRRVVVRLRDRGFDVVEVTGWEGRGRGPMTTRGRIEHHTATPRSAAGDAPTLRVVTYGHGTLNNSLSRWYVSRSGVIYLIALGVSWHAGAGHLGTNATLSGTEAEHSGQPSEPWHPRSLDAQAAISQEEAAVFGFGLSRVFDHREHAPTRKVDRVGIDSNGWRRRLAAPTPVAPAPPPVDVLEDDMLVRIDNSSTVYHVVGNALVPLDSALQADVIGGPGWRDQVKTLTSEQRAVFYVAAVHRDRGKPGGRRVGPVETADRLQQGISVSGSTPLGVGQWMAPLIRWARGTGADLDAHQTP